VCEREREKGDVNARSGEGLASLERRDQLVHDALLVALAVDDNRTAAVALFFLLALGLLLPQSGAVDSTAPQE
jgi:hypothetical protein